MNSSFVLTDETLRAGIVVRSPNWLGDAIMAFPAMCTLRKMIPASSPFYVISPSNLVPLYTSIPWINKVIAIDDGHSKWTKDKVKEVKELNAGFGFLFVNSLRSAYYFWRCVPKVFGASNGFRNIFLTGKFSVKWHENNAYSYEHQSYKYLEMAYKIGADKWDGKYPEFELISESDITVNGVADFLSAGDTLVVAPGAAYGPAKRWSSASYNQVCRYWIDKKRGKVIVLGAKNEADTAEDVINGLESSKVLNLAGKTNLKELMYILKNSKLCICNDSGIMHLGSALDIKGVAVFGSTDPYATGPLSKNWTVCIKKQNCSPCFSRECANPARDYKCLGSISADDVILIFEKMPL